MLCPGGKNFWRFHTYIYKSGPEADFGLDGWDCAGRRLEIRGELGQQEQRSASATPSRASSICSPQRV